MGLRPTRQVFEMPHCTVVVDATGKEVRDALRMQEQGDRTS